MRRLSFNLFLVLALAAALAAGTYGFRRYCRAFSTSAAKAPLQPPQYAYGEPQTQKNPETSPLSLISASQNISYPKEALIPDIFRGQILRRRVRYFPQKLLMLTFDDGPSPQITPQILHALSQYNAKATFFVLGSNAKKWPQLVRQAFQQGHAIGSHSFSHPARATYKEASIELKRTAHAIEVATGRPPELFRPPYGQTKSALCQMALKQGYVVVLWTISSADSNPIGADIIARNVIHTPNPGDIVLMHDGPGHKATALALPRILQELTAQGFRFVTIPEFLLASMQWQQQHKKVPYRSVP